MVPPRLLEAGQEVVRSEMARMNVDPWGIGLMEGKARHLVVRVESLDLRAAIILKQDLLSLGGEAALSRKAAGLKVKDTPVLIMATEAQLERLIEKMGRQPFGLAELGQALSRLLAATSGRPRFLAGDKDLLEGGRSAVMGILNVTDDSFSDGGLFSSTSDAVTRGLEMVRQGASIVDVGGESTRPGAKAVGASEEMDRVLPVIRALSREGVEVISVDTTKAVVARAALEAGASIINDISGMTFDPEMKEVAGAAGASVVLMHTRGRPDVMQRDLEYHDLLGEVYAYLHEAVTSVEAAGVPPEKICVDPGIGFGKTVEQNLELIGRIRELRSLGKAVMVGASRKSFIGAILGAEVQGRLEGSIASAAAAILKGANLVRVHDVGETVRAVKICERIAEWTT